MNTMNTMKPQNKNKTTTIIIAILSVALVLAILTSVVLVATRPAEPTPLPTQDMNAYATEVANAVYAQFTQTAAALPTLTPTPEATATPEVTPTSTPNPAATPDPATCEVSQYVADVTIPDGTEVTSGQEFTKTWQIKNIGTCAWQPGYTLIYGYGDKMSGQPVALTAAVQPGETTNVSVNLTAPSKAGTTQGYWRMANTNGYGFGAFFSVIIVVK